MVDVSVPLKYKPLQNLPITVLLQLNQALKKSLFSRKFYQELNDKVLAKTSTLDSTLYFICYFALLLSSVLNNKHKILGFIEKQRANVQRLLGHVVSTKRTLQLKADGHVKSNKTPSVSSLGLLGSFEDIKNEKEEKAEPEKAKPEESAGIAAATNAPVSKLAVHLKAISSYISDIRIFNRLVEAIKYMPWIIDEYSALMDPTLAVPRMDRFVNLAQALNCLVLELLENFGWLTDHNWVGTADNSFWCDFTYIWSSRVWGVYLVVEIIELLRRHPVSKWDADWRISLFTQVVQIPLVAHWSLYEGCLLPFWVGLCGSGASWFGFKKVIDTIDLR